MFNPYPMHRMARWCGVLLILLGVSNARARDWTLVWSDEFNDGVLDESVWSFDRGPSNDNIQYYTDRPENVSVEGGTLRLMVRKESYQGFNYTSALVKTRHSQYWRYGRIEARIKLPGTPGLVPAFWMLPENDLYGWWPSSGEIDIMEYPSSQVSPIYGTVHTEAYNLFGGSGPRGSSIDVSTAATAFHSYAVEWNADRIDFYVDRRKYYTFSNDQGDSASWPFDQPFYMILNVAVGGGWVGTPPGNATFPAIMEVDYVRVYQEVNDIAIVGPDYLSYDSGPSLYVLPQIEGTRYEWTVPGQAEILSGQNTHQIEVDWNLFGGTVRADMQGDGFQHVMEFPVQVSANLLRNAGFETGVKYWRKSSGYPAVAEFQLDVNDVHEGGTDLKVDVQSLGNVPWDIQLSQGDLHVQAGQLYEGRLWAKSKSPQATLNVAIIDANNYIPHQSQTYVLTDEWDQYAFQFTAGTSGNVLFNVDLGTQPGIYYLDDFWLSTPDLVHLNQLVNPDFAAGPYGWQLTMHGWAYATGSVEQGEYRVSINQAGQSTWDIHFGQTGLSLEQGTTYTVSFEAYSTSPRTLVAIVGKNADPWTVYCGYQSISLTTTKQTYTYSFTMIDPSDDQARLGFDLGAVAGDVFFDHISLSPTSVGR